MARLLIPSGRAMFLPVPPSLVKTRYDISAPLCAQNFRKIPIFLLNFALSNLYVKLESRKKSISSLVEAILKYVVPIAVSVGLCWLLFRDFDFSEMWRLIATECDFRWIGLMLVISVFSHIARAMRWQIQLKALGVNAPLFYVVLSIFGTYAVNLIFPRLGEVWRTGYIARRQNAPFATVFGSMVADRLADTFTVLLLLIVTLLVASESLDAYLSQSGAFYDTIHAAVTSPLAWGLVAAAILFAWWIFAVKSSNKVIVKLQQMARQLWDGFAVVAKMPGKFRWIMLTVVVWGCYFVQFYVAFYSFPFTAGLIARHGVMPALVGFVFSSIAMGVPSNGGIGPWQWAVIFALGIYGLDGERAGAFANLVLGSNTLLVIALGLFTFITIALSKKNKNKISENK